jgi:hypothetical protein
MSLHATNGAREPVRGQAGAWPKHGFVFIDRLLATLAHLRTGLTHEAPGVLYEVGSSAISRTFSVTPARCLPSGGHQNVRAPGHHPRKFAMCHYRE